MACVLHTASIRNVDSVLCDDKERKMVNVKLGEEITTMEYSVCHEHGTDVITNLVNMTCTRHGSRSSSVDRASNQCTESHKLFPVGGTNISIFSSSPYVPEHKGDQETSACICRAGI